MRVAEDRATWREVGEAYVQPWWADNDDDDEIIVKRLLKSRHLQQPGHK
jgi:hypothetical protein